MKFLMSLIFYEGQWDSIVCLGQGEQGKVKVKEVQQERNTVLVRRGAVIPRLCAPHKEQTVD